MVSHAIRLTIGALLALSICVALSLASGLAHDRHRLEAQLRGGFETGTLVSGLHPTRDTFSECALLLMEHLRHESLFANAIDSRWIVPGPLTCASLEVLMGMGPQAGFPLTPPRSYKNYPFGARHLAALVLRVTDIAGARSLYSAVSYAAIALWLFAALRRSIRIGLLLVPIALYLAFGFGLHRYGDNLAHAPPYFVGLLCLSVLLFAGRLFAPFGNRLALFAFMGGMMGYLDGMMGAIPVNLALGIICNQLFYDRRDWRTAATDLLGIVTAFSLGFLVVVLTRLWLLTLLHPGSVTEVLLALSARASAVVPPIGRIGFAETLAKLWSERAVMARGGAEMASVLLVAGAAAWTLSLVALPFALRQDRAPLVDAAVVSVAAAGVVAWYWMFLNHSYIHAFFMARTSGLVAACGFVVLWLVVAPPNGGRGRHLLRPRNPLDRPPARGWRETIPGLAWPNAARGHRGGGPPALTAFAAQEPA